MMLRCCLQGVLTQVERRGCCTGTLHILRLSYLDTGGSGGGGVWTLTGLGLGDILRF